MAGAAGGALQSMQRIGSSVLVTIFYHQLERGGGSDGPAIWITTLCAAGFMVVALALSILDVRRQLGAAAAARHRMTSIDQAAAP